MKSVPYDPVKDFTPIARRQPALHPGRQPQTALENGRRPGHRCAPAPAHHLCQRQQHRHRGRRHAPPRPYRHPACPIRARRRPDRRGRRTGGFHVHRPGFRPALRAVRVAGAGGVHRAAQRHRPDLPSMAESGVPDFDLNSWNGWPGRTAARGRRPAQRGDQPGRRQAETRQRLAALGFDAFSGTPQDFARFVGEQRPVGQADPRCRDRAAMSPQPASSAAGPLAGVRILTSARSSWAPTPQVLGDLGADVVKVESPPATTCARSAPCAIPAWAICTCT